MPSSSPTAQKSRSSSKSESPVFVTPPRSGSESDSGSDIYIYPERRNEGEGYELQPLKGPPNESEGGNLLGENSDDDSTVFNDGDEVLYMIDGPGDVTLRNPRTRGAAKEFLYTKEEERSVVRKLDKYLVSGLAILYMLSFLDRSSKL
jgi:hypothetical protein